MMINRCDAVRRQRGRGEVDHGGQREKLIMAGRIAVHGYARGRMIMHDFDQG